MTPSLRQVFSDCSGEDGHHLGVFTAYSSFGVFLVNADDKGSRVTVIEGEVRVQQGTVEKSLRPGEQLASNPKSENLQFFLETGWSREAFAYLSNLHESMAQSLAARQSPGRTTSVSDKAKFEEASKNWDCTSRRARLRANSSSSSTARDPRQTERLHFVVPNHWTRQRPRCSLT